MATVPEFISVAARMILTAISARLAAMTLLKKGTSQDAFTEVTQSGVETSGLLTLVETSSEIDTLNGLCLTEKDDLGVMRAAVDVAVNSSVNALVKSTILDMLNAEIVTFRKICSCYALLDRGLQALHMHNIKKCQILWLLSASTAKYRLNVPQYGHLSTTHYRY